ncbi:glycosyltransferase family 25 protein [Yoonia sp. 2307UL14-13]|uniref:glycosyltransferase family 25 protein n=1 Tax=Yoonia sp. 2307UL14-13 TaxID=3126506 RepID=UPI00309B5EDC
MHPISCYYINLARSALRRQHMEQQFEQLGVNAIRVEAVDGKTLASADIPPLSTRAKEKWHMTMPEIACLLSHRKVWRMICASHHEYSIVLEDDVKLSTDIGQFLNSDAWIPKNVACIKIDTSEVTALHANFRTISPEGFRLSRPVSDLHSTAGYLISRQRAERLLSETRTVTAPVDRQMFSVEDPDFLGLDYRQLHPAVCTQSSHAVVSGFLPKAAAKTTIPRAEPVRPAAKIRMPFGWNKIKRELLRPFRRLAAKLRILGRFVYSRLWQRAVIVPVHFSENPRLGE